MKLDIEKSIQLYTFLKNMRSEAEAIGNSIALFF